MKRVVGILSEWNDERGFGFVLPESEGQRAFAHVSEFPRGPRPTAGCRVSYVVSQDERGRARARDIRYVGRAPAEPSQDQRATAAVVAALGFLGFVGGAVVVLESTVLILLGYVIVSFASWAMYRADKTAAQNYTWRTSESTLHAVDVLGGWPGGLVARHQFRHKTRKQPFRTVFWLTVVLNCAALAWLLTTDSVVWLQR